MTPVIDPRALGLFISKHREERNMTQEQLAAAAHISRSYLAQIETRGRVPSEKVMQRLFAVLKAPMGEFIEIAVRGNLPDTQTDALKDLMGVWDVLVQQIEPQQLMELMASTGTMEQTITNIAALSDQDIDLDFGPKGWDHLGKSDRALVQRLVNRLLKDDADTKEADHADQT